MPVPIVMESTTDFYEPFFIVTPSSTQPSLSGHERYEISRALRVHRAHLVLCIFYLVKCRVYDNRVELQLSPIARIQL